MPRPMRAQGRPGTRVIPKAWSESHAPVVERTWTTTCTIHAPGSTGAVTVGADLAVSVGDAAEPVYTGGCRVQQLGTKQTVELMADQQVTGAAYLVVIGRAVDVELRSVIAAVALPGRRLVVVKVGRGSEQWETDLYAVEDQSASEVP